MASHPLSEDGLRRSHEARLKERRAKAKAEFEANLPVEKGARAVAKAEARLARSNRLPVLANEIKDALARAKSHSRARMLALMDAGDRLIEARDSMPHGEWAGWLKENFKECSDRSARLYMQLAEGRAAIEAAMEKMATCCHFGIREALEAIALAEPEKRRGLERSEEQQLRSREFQLELTLPDKPPAPGPAPKADWRVLHVRESVEIFMSNIADREKRIALFAELEENLRELKFQLFAPETPAATAAPSAVEREAGA